MIKTESWAPKTVLVSGFPIAIEIVRGLKVRETECWGSFSAERQKIALEVEFPTEEFGLSILLHEICHACYWVRNLRGKEPEEGVCSAIAPFLVLLFKENPGLRKLIQRLR